MRSTELYTILILLNIAVEATESDDYVYLSVFAIRIRNKFGFPINFRSLKIYYFDEWDSYESTWISSWNLVKGANYEVPDYLKNKSHIPNNWRSYCAPGVNSKGNDAMLIDFLEDDYAAGKDGAVHIVSDYESYWHGDWLHLFVFFYNLCLCLKGEKTERTCPNACWKQNICSSDPNSIRTCRPVRNPLMSNDLHSSRTARFADIYSIDYECMCRVGFKFSQKTKKCIAEKVSCDDKRYGKSPCRNKGVCKELSVKERPVKSVTFQCTCRPAWQGYVCQKPRNPCRYAKDLCGVFPCVWDPMNGEFGYLCQCSRGYTVTSQTDPKCININECAVAQHDSICLNGGICEDLVPEPLIIKSDEETRFRCKCKYGFTGKLCERPPPPVVWSSWGDWTACSVSCGMGIRSRVRTCPQLDECKGSLIKQSSVCSGVILSCESASVQTDEDGKTSLILQSKDVLFKRVGVLWSSDDSMKLEDAFTWSEQQFRVPDSQRSESHDELSLGALLGDIMQWSGLESIGRRWTYKQMAVILAIITCSIVSLIGFLILILKICEPKRKKDE